MKDVRKTTSGTDKGNGGIPALLLSEKDTVATLLSTAEKGVLVSILSGGGVLLAADAIPLYHKIALRPVFPGRARPEVRCGHRPRQGGYSCRRLGPPSQPRKLSRRKIVLPGPSYGCGHGEAAAGCPAGAGGEEQEARVHGVAGPGGGMRMRQLGRYERSCGQSPGGT